MRKIKTDLKSGVLEEGEERSQRRSVNRFKDNGDYDDVRSSANHSLERH